jgi:hypothetical protein
MSEDEAAGGDTRRATIEYLGPNGERAEDWLKHGVGKKNVLLADEGNDTIGKVTNAVQSVEGGTSSLTVV